MKILHLITGLNVGGANMMLYKLLASTDQTRFEPSVIVMMDKGVLGAQIENLGIPVHTIGMSRGRYSLPALWRLGRMLKELRPNAILAWTYHSNIAASMAAPLAGNIPVIWNIRHTPYDLGSHKKMTALLIRLGAWLSKQPACTIYNSQVSAERHKELGYTSERQLVIPNGFDTERFSPSPSARLLLRHSLGLNEQTPLIGMVTRYHPQKDHVNFVQAAAKLNERQPGAHFILVGRGIDKANIELVQLIKESDLIHNVHLLGERSDIPEITAGLDIATLTSAWGEAFPNVIGEAMACGVPCVVTNVGDSARIVDGTGIVVPPRNPNALACGWEKMLELGIERRTQLGQTARQTIIIRFSLSEIVRQYEDLCLNVIAQPTQQTQNKSEKQLSQDAR